MSDDQSHTGATGSPLDEAELQIWRDSARRLREVAKGLRAGSISPDDAMYEHLCVSASTLLLPLVKRSLP